ncbi:molybdopterin-guanine dinucleotide biosynthesis protein B [Andreprevotia chitinilytica]|uniref:molybdopterin-guanine dinucleotide biosynthesis protein B n=1 Tax=Andreprevotia chitinilytica TaxID=396808 RepID=UPI00054D9DA6|nr:molybdopterin-guanine dinucleotide biosynthesis protein B [Andreprevotia chitinilytica]
MKVFGFTGHSGSGKTTLIEAMLPVFAARGLKVNVLKHSHHDIQFEPPTKDSARFRAAGAQEVVIATPYRIARFEELRGALEPTLDTLLARLAPADLTLVESFTDAAIPKLEVFRPALGKPLRNAADPYVVAIASDSALNLTSCDAAIETILPVWPLNEPATIAQLILQYLEIPQC